VEQARAQIAELIRARPNEVVFTSGATEADNLAIGGVVTAVGGGHVVTAATEHKAVLETVLHYSPSATVVPVDERGRVDPAVIAAAIQPDTVLVSVMSVNNEVGTKVDLMEIGAACRERGVLFHTDGAQAIGKVWLDVSQTPIDLLSMSAHKMYGPKGVGALWIRRGARAQVRPLMYGGGHEGGFRSGTINVAGCAGFGEAARLAIELADTEVERLLNLRRHVQDAIKRAFPCARLNGDPDESVPGILNVWLPGVDADSVLLATPTVAASTGSACTSAAPSPSHVLMAMGRSHEVAGECIRLSFGRFTTVDDLDHAVAALATSAARLREVPAGVGP